MWSRFCLISIFLWMLTSCDEGEKPSQQIRWEEISGRDEGLSPFLRKPLYRAKVPVTWIKVAPSSEHSIVDTTQPICEFFIPHGEDQTAIHLTVHNFPTDEASQRIPTEAQVSRWQRQLTDVDELTVKITPQSFSGFYGLSLDATGKKDHREAAIPSKKFQEPQNGVTGGSPGSVNPKGMTQPWVKEDLAGIADREVCVLGWSLLLADEHYSRLSFDQQVATNPERKVYLKQMRADVTIKATGSPSVSALYKKEISQFVRSFELIEEVPSG